MNKKFVYQVGNNKKDLNNKKDRNWFVMRCILLCWLEGD